MSGKKWGVMGSYKNIKKILYIYENLIIFIIDE